MQQSGKLSEEDMRRFAAKQSKADAVIEAIGSEWAGEVLPTPDTLGALVAAFFASRGESEWYDHAFGTTYWRFLVEGYLRSRRVSSLDAILKGGA